MTKTTRTVYGGPKGGSEMATKRNVILAFGTIFLLLTATFAFSGGNAEAGGEVEEGPITLEYWDFHNSPSERELMETFHQQYSETQREVIIKYRSIPQSEYVTALTTAFAADSGPDFFQISPGEFLRFVNSGVAMDLTSFFTDDILNDFLESSIDAVRVNGKIYAVPYEIELLGLFYNIDMLSEAGIDPPKTWEEYVEATAILTTEDTWGATIEPAKGYYGNFVWYPWLWQGGGRVLNREEKKATFDTEAVRNALQLWRDLVEAGAPGKLPSGTWDESYIGQEQTAMQFTGTWTIPTIETDFKDVNIGVVPLPIPEGGQPATDAGGWKFMVNGRSDKAKEAAELIMWSWAQDVGIPTAWATEAKFAYPPRRSVVENAEDVFMEGLRAVFTEQIYDSAIPEPRFPAEIVDAVGTAIQDALFTDKPIEQITAETNRKMQDFLDDFEGEL